MRFSLIALAGVVVVAGVLLGWGGRKLYQDARREAVLKEVVAAGGKWQNSGADLSIDFESALVPTAVLAGVAEISPLFSAYFSNSELDPGALTALSEAKSLERLKLVTTIFPGDELRSFRSCSTLRNLHIEGCKLTSAQFDFQQTWPSLTDLNLDGTLVDGASYAWMSKLTALRHVSLKNTQVGDDGISALQALPNLETLSLQGTRVTEASFPTLAKFPALTSLNLPDGLDPQAIEQLRKELPNTTILAF